ncbi:phosphatase PAP2 family protein [Paenibacillus sp. M.A.Huq-81]
MAAWIMLMFFVGSKELEWSIALYNEQHSAFGRFFEIYGEHPAFIVLLAAGSLLYRTSYYTLGKKQMLMRLAGGLSSTAGGFAVGYFTLARQFDIKGLEAVPFSILIGAALIIAAQLLLRRVSVKTMQTYTLAAWAGIAIVVTEMILVNVLKISWGRLRFRNMNGDYSLYTSWFLPQGLQQHGIVSQHHKSFPSGHSANGWTMLAWALFMPMKSSWRTFALAAAVGWGLCTSYSRIIMGDHFATDVLFGAFLTIISMIFWCKWLHVPLYPLQNGSSAIWHGDASSEAAASAEQNEKLY